MKMNRTRKNIWRISTYDQGDGKWNKQITFLSPYIVRIEVALSFKRKVADPAYICTQLAKKILKAQKSNITSLSLTIMWHKIRGKLNILDSVWALYHVIRLQEKLDVISNWNNPSPLCSAICLSHVIVSSVRSDCCFFSVQPGWSASLLAQLGSVSQPSQSRLLGCPNL